MANSLCCQHTCSNFYVSFNPCKLLLSSSSAHSIFINYFSAYCYHYRWAHLRQSYVNCPLLTARCEPKCSCFTVYDLIYQAICLSNAVSMRARVIGVVQSLFSSTPISFLFLARLIEKSGMRTLRYVSIIHFQWA